MKTLRFADLKHKMSPTRRAEIARAAKAEVPPAMTRPRLERLKAKGWRFGSAADFITPQIVDARYVRDFVIWLRFSDGVEGEVDLAGELQGPIFEPLRDIDYFRRFTLNPSLDTIVWPNGADLAPEFLYERLPPPCVIGIAREFTPTGDRPLPVAQPPPHISEGPRLAEEPLLEPGLDAP